MTQHPYEAAYDSYMDYLNMMYPPVDEEIQRVTDCTIAVMEEWHQAILDGTAHWRLPDPAGKRYEEEHVDRVIEVTMRYFRTELAHSAGYHAKVGVHSRGVPMDQPPLFEQLEGASREAFVQAVKAAAD